MKNLIVRHHLAIALILIVIPTLELLLSGFSFFYSHEWVNEKFFVWVAALISSAVVVCIFAFLLLEYLLRVLRLRFDRLSLEFVVLLISFAMIPVKKNLYFAIAATLLIFLLVKKIAKNKELVQQTFSSALILSTVILAVIVYEMRAIYGIESGIANTSRWAAATENIFLIIYDELPSHYLESESGLQLSSDLIPNISKFSVESTYYNHAKSVSTNTIRAVPSLLTGRAPQDLPPTAVNFPNSLFSELSGGYRIIGYEPYTRVCPAMICDRPQPPEHYFRRQSKDDPIPWIDEAGIIGFVDTLVLVINAVIPQSLVPDIVPSTDGRWANFSSANFASLTGGDYEPWAKLAVDQRIDQYAFTNNINTNGGATFWFLHWNPPHAHEYYPNGEVYKRSQPYSLDNHESESMALARVEQFWAQAKYMDAQFGEFIEKLKDLGLYESSLIVFTSDHGMSLIGDRRGQNLRGGDVTEHMDYAAWLRTLYVPLIIKYPNQDEGRVVETPVSLLDIAPTVLSVAGAPTLSELRFDGSDLRTVGTSTGATPTYWDYLGGTAEDLGISTEKLPPFLANKGMDLNQSRFDGIPGKFVLGLEPYAFLTHSYQEQIPKIEGEVMLRIDRTKYEEFAFLGGEASVPVKYHNSPIAIVAEGGVYCGFLGMLMDGSKGIVEGFLSRECESLGANKLHFYVFNEQQPAEINALVDRSSFRD